MMRSSLVLLTLLALLAATAGTPVEAQSATAAGGFKVKVTEVDAGFGPEGWKDTGAALGDVTKTSPLPTGPVVYRNPYFQYGPHTATVGPVNDWGYNATLTLDLINSAGQSIEDPTADLFIEASISTAMGPVPAKLTKMGATRFAAQFDLDGEGGAPWPALLSGTYTLAVDVFRQSPGANPEKVGTDAVPITFSFANPSLPSFGFPRSALQVYSDLGNLTLMHGELVSPDQTVTVTFPLGVANAAGRVTVANDRDLKVVHSGTTDAAGNLVATFTPADVLGDAAGGLLAVDGHLTGSGTSGGTTMLGHGLVVLPVGSHATKVTGISRETRAPTNASDDPSAMVRITVWDPDATPQTGARYGRLVVMQGSEVLENLPIPPAEPGSDLNHKFARFPAQSVAAAGASSYTVYAFLFDERNDFYSLSAATRGVGVTAPTVDVPSGARGNLPLTVRNLNGNGDGQLDYGLALTADVVVTNLPGGGSWSGEITLDEGTSSVLDVPVPASRAGRYTVQVNVSAAELGVGRAFTVTVDDGGGGVRGVLDRLLGTPAPGAFLAIAALGAAAFVVARRRT